MSIFLSKLENVKNRAVEATDKMIAFSNAFDDLYSYCVEAHEAKQKRQGQQVRLAQPPKTGEHPLMAAYLERE